MLFVSPRAAGVAVAVSLLLLLLSSVSLLVVQAQVCTTVFGDLTPTDYPSGSVTMPADTTLVLGDFVPSAAVIVNTISYYHDASLNTQHTFSLRLSIYSSQFPAFVLVATAPQVLSFTPSTPSGLYRVSLSAPVTLTPGPTADYLVAAQASAPFTYPTQTATAENTYTYSQYPYAGGAPFALAVLLNNHIVYTAYDYSFPIAAERCTFFSSSSSSGSPSPSSSSSAPASLSSSASSSSALSSSLSSSSSLALGPASGRGDPLFTGFYGQQFYISGSDGAVMTVLASHNMQVNGRLVQLEDGQSLLPYEQDKLRQASELRLSDDPTAPAALPTTTAWTHPGTYFAECGVVLFDDNRLHAKAGGYEHGWAALTFNRRPLPVSDVPIVIGQGANTTYIHRTSSHTLTIRTHTLQLTLVNSDRFLNIERVQLESGYDAKTQLGGILGGTANASWSWQPAVEVDNTIVSGDLFDRQQMDV